VRFHVCVLAFNFMLSYTSLGNAHLYSVGGHSLSETRPAPARVIMKRRFAQILFRIGQRPRGSALSAGASSRPVPAVQWLSGRLPWRDAPRPLAPQASTSRTACSTIGW
jgi:hypothetical protein